MKKISMIRVMVAWFLAVSACPAATITLQIGGNYGTNLLSGGSPLPGGSVVEFGLFLTGTTVVDANSVTSFITSNVSSARSQAQLDSSMSLLRSNLGWTTLASINTDSVGNFSRVWTSGAQFDIGPTVGYAGGISLVGVQPWFFVTSNTSNKEYGIFQAASAFPTGGTGDNDLAIDVYNTQFDPLNDSPSGVFAFYGTALTEAQGLGIQTATIPEPSVFALGMLWACCLLSVRRKNQVHN